MTVDPWRHRGTRDPMLLLQEHEAHAARKTKGCFACVKRPISQGGNGKCDKTTMKPGCGFIHDGGVGG